MYANHTVLAVEPAGHADVYNLEVPGTENFIANDICVHNSMSALGFLAYGLRRAGRVTMRDVERLTRPDPAHPANAPWPTARPRQIKSTRF